MKIRLSNYVRKDTIFCPIKRGHIPYAKWENHCVKRNCKFCRSIVRR